MNSPRTDSALVPDRSTWYSACTAARRAALRRALAEPPPVRREPDLPPEPAGPRLGGALSRASSDCAMVLFKTIYLYSGYQAEVALQPDHVKAGRCHGTALVL